jgi:hypothetical protein
LTTDGSGLGGGRRRRAAPESSTAGLPERLQHGVPSSGGLPAGRTATWGPAAWRRPASGSGGLLGPAAWQCSRAATWGLAAQQCSPPLLLLFFFSPCSFLFLPEQQLRQGHGACALRSSPSTPSTFPSLSGFAAQQEEKPHGLLDRGRRRTWGTSPWAAAQHREKNWGGFKGGGALGFGESGRRGFHSGARGGHPVAQRRRERAMAGVGHGGRRGRRPCLASRWGRKETGRRDKDG